MKLLKLTLENFQGIKNKTLDFSGGDAAIYGDNATGKTTINNAYTWLLFDKPSTGAKNFTPKTRGKDGDMHNLSHAAEAQFQADSGRIITLRKDYHEVYKTTRGSASKTFDGHTTDFYVDGVPVKEKEYLSTIANHFGTHEQLKMLTMPAYFPEAMPWESRRKLLLEICGDVSDADVIASDEGLAGLNNLLLMQGTEDQFYSVDEYKKIVMAQRAKINKDLHAIPGRIDEAQRAIPDLDGVDKKAVEKKIADLEKTKAKVESDKAKAMAGGSSAAALRERIADARAKISEARATHMEAEAAKNKIINDEIAAIRDNIRVATAQQRATSDDLKICEKQLADMVQKRKSLLEHYAHVQERAWSESSAICPACNRPLPEDEVQKLREEFNKNKSDELISLNAQGQKECSKGMIADLEAHRSALEISCAATRARIESLEKQLVTATEKLSSSTPFEDTDEYANLNMAIKTYQEDEDGKEQAMAGVLSQYDDKIRALRDDIEAQGDIRAKFAISATQTARIAELEKQESDLAAADEELERGISLCDLFVKTKVSMLTDKINERFKGVRFRLFIDQVNGGVKEDCEVLVPNEYGALVPFPTANNAGRINAGMEIIGVLSRHWGLSMPVFVDNAESVTRINHPEGIQVIELIVSETDKKLRMEIGK